MNRSAVGAASRGDPASAFSRQKAAPAVTPTIAATVTVVAMLALVSTLRASDPVPIQLPPQNDQITAAKEKLDELKTASNAAGENAAAPVLAVPQFQPRDDSVPPPTPSLTPQQQQEAAKRAQKQSANWLVDAMMNPKSGQNADGRRDARDGRRTRRDDPLGLGKNSADKPTDRPEARDDEKTADEIDREKPKPADTFNPLAQYMSDWLTPSDYASLKQTIESPAPASGSTAWNDAPLPAPADLAISLGGLDLDATRPEQRTISDFTKPADNPYLQLLAPPESARVNLAPPPAAFDPPPAPTTFAPPPPAPESPKSRLPDFVKPLDDDKYFKPLKRF